MAYLLDQFPRAIDAFGRYRVSEPTTIFDSKQIADKQPLFWDDQQTAGAGTSSTFNAGQASTTIAVANLTAGTRIRQTFRAFNYQPGKSQLVFATFVLGAAATGITRRVGQFSAANGLFLEQISTGLRFVRRTSTSGAPVDNAVAQAAWNLDPLNGSGPSGITLDPTLSQILVVDYEWLGVGRVRMGFVIDGQIIYAHEFLNANVLALVYMGNPNLPLRYEIANSGAGPAAGLVHICSTVISEGGRQETGLTLATSRGSTPLTTNNDANLYPLIAMRLQASYQFASVRPLGISILCTSTSAYRWALLLNPTVAGTALAFTPIANSAVEVDVSRTNATTVTGGTGLSTGYGQAAATGDSQIPASSDIELGATIAGVSDIVVLAVQRLTGAAETFYAALGWREVR